MIALALLKKLLLEHVVKGWLSSGLISESRGLAIRVPYNRQPCFGTRSAQRYAPHTTAGAMVGMTLAEFMRKHNV
jgi:hypothetical protein